MRKNSIKNTRINTEVQKELSILISREIKDPRINPMTSVVAVEVAPDLKTAKVFISVMGDNDSKVSTLRGLKSAASFMRGQLARTLNLRNTPELTFVIDNSIEYGIHMSKLIDEVNRNNKSHQFEENEVDDSDEYEDEDQDDYEYDSEDNQDDDGYDDDGDEDETFDDEDSTKEEDE